MTDATALETSASEDRLRTFWTVSPGQLCSMLACTANGLSSDEAAQRLNQYGPNSDVTITTKSRLRAVLQHILEPLSLILLATGIVSVATGDTIGGAIIVTITVTILALSIGLDTMQEGQAMKAAEVLSRSVALKAEVKRDGAFVQVDVEKVMPGDLLRVRAGDINPGGRSSPCADRRSLAFPARSAPIRTRDRAGRPWVSSWSSWPPASCWGGMFSILCFSPWCWLSA